MAAPLATYEDVEERWRTLSSDEQATATVLIRDASALVRAEYPDTDDRIASGALDDTVVAGVVASMVKSAMLSPRLEGVTQQAETAGPFSQSFQFANPNGALFLTTVMRTLLIGRRPKAVSVRYSN